MHDPMTVAFEIHNPFLPRYSWGKRWSNRPSLVTIWHVDPERDGSDDSCGWSAPRLTNEQRKKLESLAFFEAREPWALACKEKGGPDPVTCESLVFGLVELVSRALRIRMTVDEMRRVATQLVHNPGDNIRSSLSHIPGYSTNFDQDLPSERERAATGLYCCIARNIMRSRRPWYRHPRWHVWHWKIQVHPLQNLKRWLFSRCCRCGKGFHYGEAPCSGSWSGTGPRWFRSEENTYHHNCHEQAFAVSVAQEESK